MAKKILYQDNARRALERGMEVMVEAVSVTLGPKGRNVTETASTIISIPRSKARRALS